MSGTRDRIVTATNELFRRTGYNGTSLKDIIRAAGATTGSLYHFFPGGKADLAEAVITESGRAYQALFELIADEASGPVEAIGDFFEGAADVLVGTDFIDVCPIGTVAREVASVDDSLRLASDRVFAGWIGAAADRFTARGLPEREAAELATTVVAALEGGFILSRAGRDAAILRAIGRQMQELVASRLAEAAPTGG